MSGSSTRFRRVPALVLAAACASDGASGASREGADGGAVPDAGAAVDDGSAEGDGDAGQTPARHVAIFRTLSSGHFLTAAEGGGADVEANRLAAQAWETLTLVDVQGGALESGDLVQLQAAGGQFLRREGEALRATGSAAQAERFRILKREGDGEIASGDLVGLEATSGRYVSATDGGGGGVTVSADEPAAHETLQIALDGALAVPRYVHAEGTALRDARGEALFLSGINLGNWLVWEGYLMMGDYQFRTHTQFLAELASALGGSERAAQFEHAWRMNYVDARAISDLADLRFNAVRAPFHYTLFYRDGALVDDGFTYLDRLVEACRAEGLVVLLDMHGAPGYQNPGDHADNVDSNASQPRDSVAFWDGDNVQRAAAVWRHVAAHYKGEPVVWGYDLINEPVPQPGREYELLGSMVTMRDAIREVDNNHVIVAEGNWWGSDLTKLDWQDGAVAAASGVNAPWDDNLVYEIHHYGPAADTMGREAVTNRLGIPLILGEYGESDDANLAAITGWAKGALAGYFPWSFKKVSHDKTLWTVPTNEAYETVKAFIRDGGSAPTGEFDAMLDFAQTNARNGHESHVFHASFYDAVAPD